MLIARQFVPNLFGEIVSHVTAIFGSSVDVVKKRRNLLIEPGTQSLCIRNLIKFQPVWPIGRSGDHQHENPVRTQGSSQQHGGSSEMSERDAPKRAALLQRRRWQIDPPEQIAWLQYVLVVAGDEIFE